MSMFISKALRRAEVFLEQVDESVAQASRRLVVEGATGDVDDNETDLLSDDDNNTSIRRASSIPTAEFRTRPTDESEEDKTSPQIVDQPVHADGENEPPTPPRQESLPEHPRQQQLADSEPSSEPPSLSPNDTEPNAAAPSSDVGMDQPASPPQQDTVKDDSASAVVEPQPVSRVNSSNEIPSSHPTQPSKDPVPAVQSVDYTAPDPRPNLTTPSPLPSAPSHDQDFVIALRAENAELRKELESVETDFEQSRRERSKLVKNIKRMKDVVSEMDESLRDKSTEARQLQEQLLQTKEQLESLRSENTKAQLRGKDEIETIRNDLMTQIGKVTSERDASVQELNTLREENERLNQALLHGHEVDLATADGARQEASQAHRAYEAEASAHRETRQLAKDREEALQEEAALAARALAAAQRKAEECTVVASDSKSALRTAEGKLSTVTKARDAAFARIEDLEETVRMFKREEGDEAPGQREAKAMQQTVCELENALEAKNVEISRLEGEVEAVRAASKGRRDGASPRAPTTPRTDMGTPQEVEMKLRHMADAALRKQAQLEALRSENRALQHQLTTERKRTREAQAMAAAASSSTQSIRGGFRGILEAGEDARSDRLYGIRDGPLARFRTPRNWPRPIAKVIGGLDRFTAQGLAILRKEPLLRIVILLYLAAMHLFVYSLLHWHVEAVSGEEHAARLTGGRAENVGARMHAAAQ